MHTLTFYPLGNADCCLIELEGGRSLLFDYAATGTSDRDDLRCDLPALLKRKLTEGRKFFDVVAFSHLDSDHFRGATEFFWLEHAGKYQTEGRVPMPLMWVPAAFITEAGPDDEEGRILQREARHRFRQGRGIRIFSRPGRLRDWCEKNGVELEERLPLFTDAGSTVPEFSLANDGAEVFVHSPFAVRQNAQEVEDRNGDCLAVQVVFEVEGVHTRALFLADAPHEALADIVRITKMKNNEHRLEWDVAKLPHHCSYLSLSSDNGETVTKPVPEVDWLYSEQGAPGSIAVSSSRPIPEAGSDADEDPQPPHRQAAAYYKRLNDRLGGEFVVTMEHPNIRAPGPLVIEIGKLKATRKKPAPSGAARVTYRVAPRAG